MRKDTWEKKIRQQAEEAGTYKEYFDPVISALAEILEQRDRATADLHRIGEDFVIEGKRNPLVVIWTDLNKVALAYWKELGLTPSGLAKLNDDTFKKQEKKQSMAELLKKVKEEE